jgi:hypothetical protein
MRANNFLLLLLTAGGRVCHTRFALHVDSTAHPDSLGTLVFPTDDALGRMVSIIFFEKNMRKGQLIWTATDGATGRVFFQEQIVVEAIAGINHSQRNKRLGVSHVTPGVHRFEVLYSNE